VIPTAPGAGLRGGEPGGVFQHRGEETRVSQRKARQRSKPARASSCCKQLVRVERSVPLREHALPLRRDLLQEDEVRLRLSDRIDSLGIVPCRVLHVEARDREPSLPVARRHAGRRWAAREQSGGSPQGEPERVALHDYAP
jgi:hypothetical protein